MVLFEIGTRGSQYRFYAIGSCRDRCELLEFLNALGANYQASRNALFALFDRISVDGPIRDTEKSHKLNDVWEFIEGDLRVFYFYDRGRLIICTHGIIKKGKKTKKRDIRHAEKLREEYIRLTGIAALTIIPFS